MNDMRMDAVKAHFEEAAQGFDTNIKKTIPNYSEMVDSLVSMIPFPKDSEFSMIDLGCGTGTIAKTVQSVFPNVDITCVDVADKMLEIAKAKIGGDAAFIHADLHQFEFPAKYQLIVSSLALHHLEDDNEKLKFYEKVYSALADNGVFINIDLILGSDDAIQEVYMLKWKEFMLESFLEEEIINDCLPRYYAEDRPAELMTHLDMLRECGFSSVDVIYKYYNFAVYMGKKLITR